MHREGYPTQAAAEEVAWDTSRFVNPPLGGERVDEAVPPIIAEGTDMPAAQRAWLIQLGGRHPRDFRRY